MPDEFEIGDEVIFEGPGGDAPAVIVAKTQWAETFTPQTSYRISVFGQILETWADQISRAH